MSGKKKSMINKHGLLGLALVIGWLGGCKSLEPVGNVSGDKRPLPFTKLQIPKAELLDERPLSEDLKDQSPSEPQDVLERRLEMPSRVQTSSPASGVSEYPDNLIKGVTAPDTSLVVELIFDAATIDEVVAAFAAPELLNFSYLVDPSVKGAVTMTVKAEMTAREAWATFEHILWLSGAYASMNPGFIHILPFERMPKERRIFAEHEVQPNVEVVFIPIRYKKSADVLNVLKPFMTDGATVTDLADSNTLIIVEAPANVFKLQELIKRLDTKGEREWPVRCFQCREVDAEELTAELQTLLPVLGMPVASGTGPSGGAIKITSLPRVGAIVVSAVMEEVLDEVATWVKLLDRTDMLDKEEIFFYNVRHSTVENLSAALDAFFNTTTSSSPTTSSTTRSTSTRATATTGSANVNSTSSTRRTTAQGTTGAGATTSTGTAAAPRTGTAASRARQTTGDEGVAKLHKTVFDTDVTVHTDSESNRLTVKTTPRTWNMVKVFLTRQDVPPRQVSIQAIITDINLTKETEYGISYSISKMLDSNSDTLAGMINSAGNIGTDTTIGGIMTKTGLGLLFKDSKADPLAFLTAFAGAGNTRILSEPHVLALSGATAVLQVGESIAVPTESTSYSTDSDTMRSNYEYIDTGVIMTVTPYITAGNDVRLEIDQEVSDAQEASNVNLPPTITKKKMSTQLVVPDNSTLMMGGMIKNTNNDSNSGVPWLKDIPYLGRLFRYNSNSNSRSELLILLTVNVVDNTNPQEELVRRYRASLEEIEKNRDTSMY